VTKLRVGVIGLGEVAQVIHLPILESLPDHYEVAAVCDISPGLLKRVGDRFRVERRYADAAEMVAAGGLDCVLVLNSDEYHAECTVAALDAGLHVLVEKPMCLSPREADEIIAARDRSGKTVMVAYMRRFAPAFTQAVETG
jgi:predicted dehydrogenase